MLRIRTGERRSGVTFGLHRRQAGPCELLCLQVALCAPDGGLGGVEIRRCRRCRAGRPGGGDGLPSVAHFLHRSAGACGEAYNTDKYSEETRHRMHGH